MSLASTTLLALSMSADAFAVSVSRGAGIDKPRLRDAARTGVVFGLMEALMPILGWLAGSVASTFIQSVDHWVAFAILAAVGLKMMVEGIKGDECEIGACSVEQEKAAEKEQHKIKAILLLCLTAVGTSVDSMAVGVSMAFVNANIWMIAASVGLASFSMSTLGLMIGHYVGCRAGRWAEVLGGLGLMGIGTKILIEHLNLFG